jgi:acetyl-CoA decarbonylase/synthase complex subunit gamma
MALTGLEIFKLLPKGNCKKCGMPTCLAFAMQLAQKRAKLDDCPEISEDAKQKLAAAAAPPMRKIAFGSGEAQVQTGQETVLFRHDEKFHSPTVVAVTVSDKLAGPALQERIQAVKALQFERVGTHVGIRAAAVVNENGSPEAFAQVCAAVKDGTGLALILVTDSPQAMAAAVKQVGQSVPLLVGARINTAEAMAKIAKESNCPLVARAASIEELADLSEKIKATGVENIMLNLDASSLADRLYDLSRMRVLSLKKVFRPLGYPTLSFVGADDYSPVPGSDASRQGAVAISLACKYSGIVVLDTVEPGVLLPLLTAVMNIYSDPQKPVQVEPKVYTVGEPNENSPLMFTTNFSLTYYSLESDVEASRVPSYILVVDTEGTSVLTAYSGDKLNEKVVAQAMQKYEVAKLVKHRKLIIPGYVAVMSGKLEEATNWEVLVGPRECSMLPKYLQDVWK